MSNYVIHEKAIPHIERALGFKLYDHQKAFLLSDATMIEQDYTRATGKTTAYCIKLALSDGKPLDLSKPEEFSDGWELPDQTRYARSWFRGYFMKIRDKFEKYGFKVRDVKGIKNDRDDSRIKYCKQILDLIDKDIDEKKSQIKSTEAHLRKYKEELEQLKNSRIEVLKGLCDAELEDKVIMKN